MWHFLCWHWLPTDSLHSSLNDHLCFLNFYLMLLNVLIICTHEWSWQKFSMERSSCQEPPFFIYFVPSSGACLRAYSIIVFFVCLFVYTCVHKLFLWQQHINRINFRIKGDDDKWKASVQGEYLYIYWWI